MIGIETTGAWSNGDSISEIGAVKVRNHEAVAATGDVTRSRACGAICTGNAQRIYRFPIGKISPVTSPDGGWIYRSVKFWPWPTGSHLDFPAREIRIEKLGLLAKYSRLEIDMAITTASELGEAIRNRRRSLGLRQQDLALAANVGVRFIVDIENGKETSQVGARPSAAQLKNIARLVRGPIASFIPLNRTLNPKGSESTLDRTIDQCLPYLFGPFLGQLLGQAMIL
ncbi:transcriptional regulator with XRE-family HTH domain [Bradyrhizobium sp. USDA 4532]|uniref:helix-turn-helix domain-containing protein n=1 Tax=unclassified Bradyrhizobium TaxID=2631580 RepID=UPI0020A18446|nr:MULTISPECIES: helix-turn-helix domain-containing protein [unclassified Bradyrhizobium]MCP1835676.1 transcriptional regulator with XRE-family HTH domain [Bradyrhizobium sp. USDA 4545]MCP1920425.1 transcriptional regulator with XRE-family HTH domain [Bradyrhizobium sp. USDA 4532]